MRVFTRVVAKVAPSFIELNASLPCAGAMVLHCVRNHSSCDLLGASKGWKGESGSHPCRHLAKLREKKFPPHDHHDNLYLELERAVVGMRVYFILRQSRQSRPMRLVLVCMLHGVCMSMECLLTGRGAAEGKVVDGGCRKHNFFHRHTYVHIVQLLCCIL